MWLGRAVTGDCVTPISRLTGCIRNFSACQEGEVELKIPANNPLDMSDSTMRLKAHERRMAAEADKGVFGSEVAPNIGDQYSIEFDSIFSSLPRAYTVPASH